MLVQGSSVGEDGEVGEKETRPLGQPALARPVGEPGARLQRRRGIANLADPDERRSVLVEGLRALARLAREDRRRPLECRAEPPRRVVERGILNEDRALQLPQDHAGLDAERLDEGVVRAPIRGQGVGLPARAVKSKHELRPQALARRMSRNELLELSDYCHMHAELEVGVEPVLERRQPFLLETCGQRRCEELRERRSAPEREGFSEPFGAGGHRSATRLGDQAAETVEIERFGLCPNPISGRCPFDDLRPEEPPERMDEVLEGGSRGSRRVSVPEDVDELLLRDRLVRTRKQQHNELSLFRGCDRDGLGLSPYRDRSEDAELERSHAARQ